MSAGGTQRPRALIFLPVSLAYLFLFVLFMLLVPVLVLTVGDILGLDPVVTGVVFVAIVLGSLVNLPVMEVESLRPVLPPFNLPFFEAAFPRVVERATTTIAVNVGGAVVPVLLSAYFLWRLPPRGALAALGAAVLVALVAHRFARPVPGLGIALPPLLPPLASVIATSVLFQLLGVPLAVVAPAAFAAGVLGTISGADLLNLKRIPTLGAAIVSIGGAGTFDGIFLTGVFATLFAALFV